MPVIALCAEERESRILMSRLNCASNSSIGVETRGSGFNTKETEETASAADKRNWYVPGKATGPISPPPLRRVKPGNRVASGDRRSHYNVLRPGRFEWASR